MRYTGTRSYKLGAADSLHVVRHGDPPHAVSLMTFEGLQERTNETVTFDFYEPTDQQIDALEELALEMRQLQARRKRCEEEAKTEALQL